MSVLKIKDENGNFIPIQTIKGDKGDKGNDGAVQYTAGDNITIENNVISATVPTKTSDLTNDSNYVSDSSYVHTDNNYTTNEKTKLAGLSNYDDTEVRGLITGLTSSKADKTELPTKVSDLTNDSGFIDKDVNNLTNYYKKSEVDTSLSGKQNVGNYLTSVPNSSSGVIGGIKTRISGTTLYITNDGSDA